MTRGRELFLIFQIYLEYKQICQNLSQNPFSIFQYSLGTHLGLRPGHATVREGVPCEGEGEGVTFTCSE